MKTAKLFLLVFAFFFPTPQPAKSEDVIRIGIISTTFGYAPVFVAKEKGFFKRENLVPEIIVISRNEQIVQALISDSLQFGNVPPNLLLILRQQGASDIKLIAGSFNGTTYSMIAQPKYRKIEDLKGSGARLAMSGITSAAAMMMKEVLKQRGVLYPRDYSLLSVGGSNVQFTALQTKQVDGALLAEPISLMAVEQGFSNLGDAYKILPDFQLFFEPVHSVVAFFCLGFYCVQHNVVKIVEQHFARKTFTFGAQTFAGEVRIFAFFEG